MASYNQKMSKRARSFRNMVSRITHCQACGSPGTYHDSTGEWLLDPAHVKSKGAGGGTERNLVGLCHKCHVLQHKIGVVGFEKKFEVSLVNIAARNWEVWREANA